MTTMVEDIVSGAPDWNQRIVTLIFRSITSCGLFIFFGKVIYTSMSTLLPLPWSGRGWRVKEWILGSHLVQGSPGHYEGEVRLNTDCVLCLDYQSGSCTGQRNPRTHRVGPLSCSNPLLTIIVLLKSLLLWFWLQVYSNNWPGSYLNNWPEKRHEGVVGWKRISVT